MDPARRRYLRLCAAGTGLLLAGCTGAPSNDQPDAPRTNGPDETPAQTPTPTSVPKIDDWQYDPDEKDDGKKVYGSSDAEDATDSLVQVNTLFPSAKSEGKTRGGVVLVQVDKQSDLGEMTLRASWEDRRGSTGETTKTITFPGESAFSEWEQQFQDLTVSDRYESRIREFKRYYDSEMSAIGDDALQQGLKTMETILAAAE